MSDIDELRQTAHHLRDTGHPTAAGYLDDAADELTAYRARDISALRIQEVTVLMNAERMRQIAKGYDADHDDQSGVWHLAQWAQNYIHRGEPIKALALLDAVFGVLKRAEEHSK